jgi:hypothetical protein
MTEQSFNNNDEINELARMKSICGNPKIKQSMKNKLGCKEFEKRHQNGGTKKLRRTKSTSTKRRKRTSTKRRKSTKKNKLNNKK